MSTTRGDSPWATNIHSLYELLTEFIGRCHKSIEVNFSPTYVAIICASLITAVATWALTSGDSDEACHRSNAATIRGGAVEPKATLLNETHDTGAKGLRRGGKGPIRGTEGDRLPHHPSLRRIDESPGTGQVDDDQPRTNLVARMKQARNRVIDRKVAAELTEEELQMEKEIQNTQLEKIYTMVAENEEKFGKMSYQDIQNQMSLYT